MAFLIKLKIYYSIIETDANKNETGFFKHSAGYTQPRIRNWFL